MAAAREPISIRRYGSRGPWVALVHGGPGAGGYLAPLAQALADAFRVLEPLQRGSGREPLTVARHVWDLDLALAECGGAPPAVVGHSWGAMLALAHAAAHPDRVQALVLVGCGTFDARSRERLRGTLARRTDADLSDRLRRLDDETADPDERLRRRGELLLPVYSYDTAAAALDPTVCDARAHDETWQDMLRLQDEGIYPASFRAITAPVLMLHGVDDPHPGRSTASLLRGSLPQLEYRELNRCGHYPWLERGAGAGFLHTLREWLAHTLGA